ncbi:MAG: hypothetical protein V2J25_11055 [Desulfatiglans sp.]|nr:hypothetical protein [Desulfatiglans sp.]
MSQSQVTKRQLFEFGRQFSLLLNRATMYEADHPYVEQAIESAYETIDSITGIISPLVYAMNRGQVFIDEEPLDPRVNVKKITSYMKKIGIQSISFDNGLDINELKAFVDIFSTTEKFPHAEAMKEALKTRGVTLLKINHVFYKKITEDDEVVSREVLKKTHPQVMDEDQPESKKKFIDAFLENALSEEVSKGLNLGNLITNPSDLAKKMIDFDISCARKAGMEGEDSPEGQGQGQGRGEGPGQGEGKEGPQGEGRGNGNGEGQGNALPQGAYAGHVLLQQVNILGENVKNKLAAVGDTSLPDLADAVFGMKKRLLEGIEAQKALGLAYDNERNILEKTNEITDSVLIKLIKMEYKKGKITTSRLAQILRRLIPEPDELKRILPKIKRALLEEGMPVSEYLNLIKELGRELKSESLARIIQESSKEIGVDGDELIREIMDNPSRAAELIYLAAEIRRETGDEKALTQALVEYVEQLGMKIADNVKQGDDENKEQQLKQVIRDIQSGFGEHLGKLNIQDDTLARLEEKLSQRMDEIMEKMRVDLFRSHTGETINKDSKQLTVLQTLERSVSIHDELGEILQIVRSKVDSGEIDENNFKQIYSEINRQEQLKEELDSQKKLPPGLVRSQDLMFFLEKEIIRAKRYKTPFSALAFSLVRAKSKTRGVSDHVPQQVVMDEVLYKLTDIFRNADLVGQLGKNKMVAFLPMTSPSDTVLALRRAMKHLNLRPVEADGILFDVKIAGVSVDFDEKNTPDPKVFIRTLFTKLIEMAARVKHIHSF